MRKILKDKRGLIGVADNFIFGMMGLAILLMIVVSLIPIQNGDVEIDKMMEGLDNAQNKTMSTFPISDTNNPLINIVYSAIHFIFYSTFEIVKISITFALDNPGFINAKTILWLIIISLSIPIIYYLILLLILIFLLIKEMCQSISDKRKLKQLEEPNQNESKGIQNKI